MKFYSYTGETKIDAVDNLISFLGFTKSDSESTTSQSYYYYGKVHARYPSPDNTLQFQYDSGTTDWASNSEVIRVSETTASCYYYKSSDGNILFFSKDAYGTGGALILKIQEGYYLDTTNMGITYFNDGTMYREARVLLGSASSPSTNKSEILVTPMILKKVTSNDILQIVSGVYSVYTSAPLGTAFSISGTNLQYVITQNGSGTGETGIPYVSD